MKAKLMNLKDNGTWTSSDNTVFFKFDAEFEGGESGSFLAKSNPPAQKVGEEHEFTVEEKNGHKNIKWVKPAGGAFQPKQQRNPEDETKRQAMIVRQSSLKAATDLVCNNKADLDRILLIAQLFTDWALGDMKAINLKDLKTDDLPF
jgi:hypothetical protein